MRLYVRLLIGLLRRSTRGRRDLQLEILVLRQQLEVYARQPKRPRLRNEDRLWGRKARSAHANRILWVPQVRREGFEPSTPRSQV